MAFEVLGQCLVYKPSVLKWVRAQCIAHSHAVTVVVAHVLFRNSNICFIVPVHMCCCWSTTASSACLYFSKTSTPDSTSNVTCRCLQDLSAAHAALNKAHTQVDDMRSDLSRILNSLQQLAAKKREIETLKAK